MGVSPVISSNRLQLLMEGPRTTLSMRADQELLWRLLSRITVVFSAIVLNPCDLRFLDLEVTNFTSMGREQLVLYHPDGCFQPCCCAGCVAITPPAIQHS